MTDRTRPPDSDSERTEDLVVQVRGVRAQPGTDEGELALEIETSRGVVHAYLHVAEGSTGCAVFIGGAAGGVEGPANGVYARLALDLAAAGVTSMRVEYREAGEFAECVVDALAACSVLRGLGGESVVLVGHSFGGAVAIRAGGLSPLVRGVAALSSQRFGTAEVQDLGCPLLLIHGADDDVLLPEASRDIYERASEPRRLVVLEGAGHALREVGEEVYGILTDFITELVGGRP